MNKNGAEKQKVHELNPFSYKAGFYEMPYLVNTPQRMVEAYKKMPAVKFDGIKQSLSAKTPALNITVRYREIEEELFLIYSEVLFKANVCFRNFQDKSTPSTYYCLSLRIDNYSKISNSLANGIGYTDNSWLIFKPGANVDHYHFKGTKGNYFSLYFTKKWIRTYCKQLTTEDRKMLNLFLNSDSDHLICPNVNGQAIYNSANLGKLLLERSNKSKASYLKKLKKEIRNFLSFFICKMHSEKITERHFRVSNLERIKLLKAEQIIKAKVFKKFPGITFISKEAGLSGTKLKECFREVYDQTPFQYFRGLQMDAAHQLIIETELPVGQIARKLGYENASKFALAFKKYYGALPSTIKSSVKIYKESQRY
ncbi:MAG: AraC family transcriptional regulator [Bacteroidota bacterium]|jgi:AraC-like DNA-binding protein|nr:AraC family transcriptional regulator [Bacteroidota bacterium]